MKLKTMIFSGFYKVDELDTSLCEQIQNLIQEAINLAHLGEVDFEEFENE